MKKPILLIVIILLHIGSRAQEKNRQVLHKTLPQLEHMNQLTADEHNKMVQFSKYIGRSDKAAAKTTAYTATAWYDMASQYNLSIDTTYYFSIYPDTNVTDVAGNIFTHGLGMSFDPLDSAYSYGFYCYHPILPHMSAGTIYGVDSFNIPIKYQRKNPSTSVIDSIIIEFAVAENPVNSSVHDSGAYNLRFAAPDPFFAFFCYDERPRFASLHYNSGCGMIPSPYNADPFINDSYFDSVFVTKRRIAIPLTNASKSDTDANGFLNICHLMTGSGATAFPIIPVINLNSSYQHLIFFVTFKSGVAYPLGTTSANFIRMYAANYSTLLPRMQSVGSFQCGLIANNELRYNDYYFTFPAYAHDVLLPFCNFNGGSGIGSQIPYAGFHVTADTGGATPVTIKFYYDANFSCVKDSTEPYNFLPIAVEVDSAGIPIDTIAVTSGLTGSVNGPTGTVYAFKVIATSPGLYISCPTSGIIYDTIGTPGCSAVKYMALNCTTSSAFDLQIFPITHAGTHFFKAQIYADNTYCTPTVATVSMHNSKYNFNAASLTPASVVSGTITWNAGSLSATWPAPYLVNVQCDSAGVYYTPGDTTQTYFAINPIAGDAFPADNALMITDTVMSGFDPNEMQVSPSCIQSDVIPRELKYTISFENTGNATANNIYVLDTLPDNLDYGSMRMVMSSHEMYTTHLKDGAGHNVVEFYFPSINLMDSNHSLNCNGAVIFTIKTKAGLPPGSSIYNRAGIYFDSNPVVMTNTAKSNIGCTANVPVVTGSSQAFIYPNPATDELVIRVENNAYNTCTITNSMGQTMMQLQLSTLTKTDITGLPPGLYYVLLRGEMGSLVRKVLKM